MIRFRRNRLPPQLRPGAIRFGQPRRRRRGLARLWFNARPFLLGAVLLAIWPTLDPALVEPPAILATEPEQVSERFSRCGVGRSHACVVDGDTFKLGQRKIRIIGIDAPEVAGRCPLETELAAAATARLQELLNAGAFEMVGRIDAMQDRYGRDLRALYRRRTDGSRQSIAADMRASGHARRYLGGLRGGWCD